MEWDSKVPWIQLYFGKHHDVPGFMKKIGKYVHTMDLLGIRYTKWEGRNHIIPRLNIDGYAVAGLDSIEKGLDSELRNYAGMIQAQKPKLKMYLSPEDKKIRKALENHLYALEVLNIPCKILDNDRNDDRFPELDNNGYLVAGLDDIKHSIDETIRHYVKSSKAVAAKA
jgi:hypothetical protein